MKLFIPQPFAPLFDKELNSVPKNFVALTGRNSGKTEAFVRYVYKSIFESKNSALIVVKNEKYIPRNILRTFKRVAIDIGIYDELNFPKSKPYVITSKKYEFTIDFFGIGDDVYNIKGYEPKNKLSLCWFEEFGEMEYDDIQIIKQTLTRNMTSSRKFMYSGNPPKQHNAWNRVWVDQVRKDENYIVFDVNCFDIYPFLSESNKLDIEELYLTDKKDFNYTYIGEPYSDGLKIYSEISDKHILKIDDALDGEPLAWSLGIDVAVVKDKTAVVLNILLNSGRIITRKSWAHDPLVSGRMTIGEQAEFIYDGIFMKILQSPLRLGGKDYYLGNYDYRVILDSSNYSLIDELRNRGVKCLNTKNKRQLRDIEKMRTLIRNNRMYFYNDKENGYPCYQLLKELYNLTWFISEDDNDEKNIEIIKNLKKTDSFKLIGKKDTENAWRYGCSWLIKWIPRYGTKLKELDIKKKQPIFKNFN